MIVTAVVEPSSYSVRLTATAYTGTVSWYRVEARDVPLGDGPVIEDRGAPLNQPVTYYAVDDVSTVSTTPVTVTAEYPVLSSTMSNAALPVTVVRHRPKDFQGRSVWHPVIGRSDPFVSVFPMTYPSGVLVLLAATNQDRLDLIELMTPGYPLLIRSTCPDRLDGMTFTVTSARDPFQSDEMREGATYLELDYQQVTAVSPAWSPPARTYQDVLDEDNTYADVLTHYGSYQDLLDGVRLP